MLICLLSVCWHCNYIESDVTLNLGFVGLPFISSFPLPPDFIIKICQFLFLHSHFRSSENFGILEKVWSPRASLSH